MSCELRTKVKLGGPIGGCTGGLGGILNEYIITLVRAHVSFRLNS